MAESLGTLTLNLIAETAQLRTGLDAASQNVTSVAKLMESQFGRVGSAIDTVAVAAKGLGVALSVGSIVEWSRGVLESADNLQKLSEITGSSVSQLSQLRNVATASGEDFGTFQTLMQKLSVDVADLGDASSKGGRALAYLGISATDPASALQEVATKLNSYVDDANKAALVTDLFGRNGAALLPTLKDIAENTRVVSTVTAEQAEQAKALGQEWGTLKVNATAFANVLLSDVAPTLTSMLQQFNNARAAGQSMWDALGNTVVPSTLGERVKTLSSQVDDLKQKLARVVPGTPEALYSPKAQARLEQLTKDLDLARQAQANYALAWSKSLGFTGDVRDALAQRGDQKPSVGKPPTVDTSGVSAYTSALDMLAKEAAQADAQLDQLFSTDKIAPAYTAFLAYVGSDAWNKLSLNQQLDIESKAHDIAATQSLTDKLKEWAQQSAVVAKQIGDEREQWEAQGKTIADNATALGSAFDAAAKYFGLDPDAARYNEAVDALNTSLAAGQMSASDFAAAIAKLDAGFNHLSAAKAAKTAADEATRAWQDSARDIDNALTDALYDGLLVKGKSFGEDLRDSLQQMFKRLVLQPLLQPIAGSLASLATGFFPTGAAAQGIGGAGSLLSSGGSILGGLSNLFGGAGGNFFGGVSSSLTNLGTEGVLTGLGGDVSAGFTALGAGNIAGGLGSLVGAALPVAGLAALAFSLFGGSKGGPKGGGFASVGDLTGLTLDSNGRYYTPTGADSTLATLAQGTGSTFTSTLAALGGSGNAGFAFGYDTDPNGSAASRLSVGASVGGQSVYSVRNRDEGSGTDQVNADLQTEAQRAILAALQASDLPTDIANIIDSLSAATASQTDVQNLIAQATALKSVTDVLAKSPLDDALAALAAQSDSTTSALTAQIAASKSLVAAFDHSAASSQSLAAAAQGIYAAEVQVIAEAESVKKSLSSMFGDTIKQFTLSTLSDQGKYDYYRSDEQSLLQQLSQATTSDQVNSLSQSIIQDFQSAFQLLGPAQQAQELAEFTQALQGVQQDADDRLAAIEAETQSQANDQIQQIHDMLSSVIAQQQKATDQFGGSVQQFSNAISKPLNINLQLDGGGVVVPSLG
jgi:hypothetical protein